MHWGQPAKERIRTEPACKYALNMRLTIYISIRRKPGGRIELLLKTLRLAHLYHTSWLYLTSIKEQETYPLATRITSDNRATGSEICSPTDARYGLIISFSKGWPPYPKTSGGSQPRLYLSAPIAEAADYKNKADWRRS